MSTERFIRLTVVACILFTGCTKGTDVVEGERPSKQDLRKAQANGDQQQSEIVKPKNTEQLVIPEKDRNIFGVDDRQPITTDEYPWRTIGMVSECGCTGTLIGPDLVLTAAHCVIEPSTKALRQDITYFKPNYRSNTSKDKSWIERIWWGTNDPDKYRSEDWAILKLREPLGVSYGYLGIQPTDVDTFPQQLTVAGYSADYWGGGTAGVHHNGITRNRYRDLGFVLHDCDSTRGASGGPVLRTYNDSLTIFGIHVAEYRRGGDQSLQLPGYSDEHANIAIPSHGFLAQAKKLLGLSRSLNSTSATLGFNPDNGALAAAADEGTRSRAIESVTGPSNQPSTKGAGNATNPKTE